MKNVMSIIKSGVGFALLAVLITVMVLYFNRGKDATTQQMDNVLSIVEGTELSVVNLASYNGKSVKGATVVSIIEGMASSNLDTPVVVFTNGTSSYAVYTKDGLDNSKVTVTTGTAGTSGTLAKVKLPATGAATYNISGVYTCASATGSYNTKTSPTYINPSLFYTVECHYNSNKTIDCVTIVQQ